MEYIISLNIRFFFLNGETYAFISKTNKRIKLNPLIFAILLDLSNIWIFKKQDFLSICSEYWIKDWERMLLLYEEYWIIEKNKQDLNLPPESLNYIYETCEYPFLNYSEWEAFFSDFSRMKNYLDVESIPERSKVYENIDDKIELQKKIEISDSIYYDTDSLKEPSNLETISKVFYYTLWVKWWISFPFQWWFLRKFVPSWWARHTTEAYLFSINIEWLDNHKIYHYNWKNNSLDGINQFWLEELTKIFPEIKNIWDYSSLDIKDIKGIVVFTSMFERSMWRYRDSRSYRVILTDIWHVIENMNTLYIQLTWKKTFQWIWAVESKVEDKLHIKSHFKESMMKYLILT